VWTKFCEELGHGFLELLNENSFKTFDPGDLDL